MKSWAYVLLDPGEAMATGDETASVKTATQDIVWYGSRVGRPVLEGEVVRRRVNLHFTEATVDFGFGSKGESAAPGGIAAGIAAPGGKEIA